MEYKFRFYDKEDKVMRYFTLDEMLQRHFSYYGSYDLRVLREEKMQYTGLKDKNGKEIYKGDVVKFEFGVGEVKHEMYGYSACYEYECERYGWHVKSYNDEYDLVNHDCVEVIGNIYENPELLNQ